MYGIRAEKILFRVVLRKSYGVRVIEQNSQHGIRTEYSVGPMTVTPPEVHGKVKSKLIYAN